MNVQTMKNQRKHGFLLFSLIVVSQGLSSLSHAQSKSSHPASKPQSTARAEALKVDAKASEDSYTAASSTHIDFTETSIDGKMKAPEGFMLQGRQSNSLNQMVKLRSNFRNELNNSRSATKALVK